MEPAMITKLTCHLLLLASLGCAGPAGGVGGGGSTKNLADGHSDGAIASNDSGRRLGGDNGKIDSGNTTRKSDTGGSATGNGDSSSGTSGKICNESMNCGCGSSCNDNGVCAKGGDPGQRFCCGHSDCGDTGKWYCSGCHCYEFTLCDSGICDLGGMCSGGKCKCLSSDNCGFGEKCVGGLCLEGGKVCK